MIIEYAPQGNRLDVQGEGATTDGALETQYVFVRAVEWKAGNLYVPLGAAGHDAPRVEDVNGTLRVTGVIVPDFPAVSDDTFLLVADGFENRNMRVFERLIAVRAVAMLLPKDGERNPTLEQLESSLWGTVLQTGVIPRGRDMTLGPSGVWGDVRQSNYLVGPGVPYRWGWDPNGSIKLVM